MASTTIDLQYIFIFLFIWLISVVFFFLFFFKNSTKKSPQNFRLPPSPRALPIIGQLHLLLFEPMHKSLMKLSSKYGPLLYIRAFHFPIVVVSSASMAYEVHRTQDVNFSYRERPAVEDSILFGSYGFVSSPYGDYWRFMKKLVVKELLGQQQLERSRGVRGEELERFYGNLLDKARKNEAVDVNMEVMKLTNNSICRMTMGLRCSEDDYEAKKVKDLVTQAFAAGKKLLIAGALRPLQKLGISVFEKEIMELSRRFDDLLEKIIKEHEENPKRENKDMMDVVLGAYQDEKAEYKITRNHMKAFFVELFLGGTDTSAQTSRWIMAELINHPNVLKKLREEIDSIVGQSRLIEETDLPKLTYLQAVVKEGLRLHPPGPLLPRKCNENCNIGGFDIPGNTTVLVNVYAIMRDPKSWEDPNEFYPERFIESSSKVEIGNKEEGVKYLPFGSGRRACPGANLAYLFMGTAIGIMVQCFDWKIDGDKVNMEEKGDMALTMAYPYKCTPLIRFDPLIPTNKN